MRRKYQLTIMQKIWQKMKKSLVQLASMAKTESQILGTQSVTKCSCIYYNIVVYITTEKEERKLETSPVSSEILTTHFCSHTK